MHSYDVENGAFGLTDLVEDEERDESGSLGGVKGNGNGHVQTKTEGHT